MINGCIFDLFGVILKGISPDESKEHFLSNKNDNLAIYLVENDNEYQYAGIFIKYIPPIPSQDNSRSSIERLQFEDTTDNRDFFIHNWENISSRNDISFRDIKNNPDLPWSYIGFSSNPNLVIETVKENLHLNWNWYSISN
jgi:hypothetical protein